MCSIFVNIKMVDPQLFLHCFLAAFKEDISLLNRTASCTFPKDKMSRVFFYFIG